MPNRPHSVLFRNGRIYRSAFDTEPASAICIAGETISWVGDIDDAPLADRVLDLEGGIVLPGLTDAHVHLFAIAQARLQVPVTPSDVRTIPDMLNLIARRAEQLPIGGWVHAAGLYEQRLAEGRLPLRSELDRAAPNNPVLVRRFCGHVAVLNSAALQALELHDGLADPQGGQFGRLPDGTLDGSAIEAAAEMVFRAVPTFDRRELAQSLRAVISDCATMGLTAAVEAAVGFTNGFDFEDSVWDLLRADALPLRLGFMLQLDPKDAAERQLSPGPDPNWQRATLKFFADGIVLSRTAAVSGGYADTPSEGLFVRPKEDLTRLICEAHQNGWQVAVHAIGDIAVDHVITALEQAQQSYPRHDPRHRIEHYFCPPRGGLPRMERLGAMIVAQPNFLRRMNVSFREAFGVRVQECAPARSAVEAGVTYVCSSDAPTGLLSPWVGMAEAVERGARHGMAIGPHEALTHRQAIASYVVNGARAMRHESFRGNLEAGKAADMVVLDRDPFLGPTESLATMAVRQTIVRGEIVWAAS